MSQHHSQAFGRDVTPRSRLAAMAAAGALMLTVALGACGGDDDDAASGTEASTPSETTTMPGESTEPAAETVVVDSTVSDTGESTTGDDTAAADTSAATDAAAPAATGGPDDTPVETDTAAATDPGATTIATGTSDAAPDGTTAGTAPGDTADGSGPTTTGPECEFVENASYPLERCNTGPAIAVLQQSLQAAGFTEIGVDGLFGDETLLAVRAFQEDEGLTVDGLVDAATWAALDPQNVGNDDNDNGVIDPNEVDLG